jgi:hypothetical protein
VYIFRQADPRVYTKFVIFNVCLVDVGTEQSELQKIFWIHQTLRVFSKLSWQTLQMSHPPHVTSLEKEVLKLSITSVEQSNDS